MGSELAWQQLEEEKLLLPEDKKEEKDLAPKLNKLKKRSEFLSVASKKQAYRAKNVVIQFDAHQTDLKFGFTASKKVGNAVKRNFAKRRLREIAMIIKKNNHFSGRFVFIATYQTCDCLFSDLLKDVQNGVSFLTRKFS